MDDVYESIKYNHIYNEDCIVGMKRLPDHCVDYVITSPPYNRERNDKYEFYNDRQPEYKELLYNSLNEMLRVCKNYIFFNIQPTYYNRTIVNKLIGDYADKLVNTIVWYKTNPNPARATCVTNAYEYILVFGNEPLKCKTRHCTNIIGTSVYTNGSDITDTHHAIMHPEIPKWIFYNFIADGSIVLDPFMGTGTTAVYALKNHCRYIGYEISKEFCDIATARIADTHIVHKLF